MCNRLTKHAGLSLGCLVFLLTIFGGNRGQAQKVDLNANGASDIWELIYSAGALDPNADSDGDGVINRLEAIAGTNPLDSNSVPRISPFVITGTNVSVSMSSALGKKYLLQSSEILCGPGATNWITEASSIARTGSV